MLNIFLKKRHVKVTTICVIFLAIVLAFGINTFVRKDAGVISKTEEIIKTEEISDLIEENKDFSYPTMQITDYEDKDQSGNHIVWECRYSIVTSSSTLYVGGKVYKEDVDCSNLSEIISFHPENIKQEFDFTNRMREQDTGILYEFLIKEAEEYVASLLEKGLTLRRKILTPTYAEVYLLNDKSKTVRIIAFKDKMLMAEIDKNELPEISSYFK